MLLGNASVTATGPDQRVRARSLSTPELVGRHPPGARLRDALHARRRRVALFLSTVTDSPLGAALGALAVLVASSLLLTLDAAAPLAPYLPTRYWLAFVDLFRDPILWRDILRGVLLQGVYVGVLLGAAWANFTTKDVTD